MKINCPPLRRALPLIALLPTVALPLAWASPAEAAPSGIRLKVSCYFRVTNAMDGNRDDEAEIYGEVRFNRFTKWSVTRDNAFGAVRDLNKRIDAGDQTFDVLFARSSTAIVNIEGFLKDRDESGGDDYMWNPMRRTIALDIRKVYDMGAQRRQNGVYTSQGDRSGESADLIIIVSKVSDIV